MKTYRATLRIIERQSHPVCGRIFDAVITGARNVLGRDAFALTSRKAIEFKAKVEKLAFEFNDTHEDSVIVLAYSPELLA